MARKAASKEEITKLSIDMGREDLNNLVIKINEVIDFLNHGKVPKEDGGENT